MVRRLALLFALLLTALKGFCQECSGNEKDTAIPLPPIVVDERRGILRVIDYKLNDNGNPWRNRQLANNLSDYLAKYPQFSQITTGGAISKPVLRGMYGNRLLVTVNGLKYDAQQWQDEHGLGLSQIGIREINTYHQPHSAEAGAEAIGGVIAIEDEQADSGIKSMDASIRLHSNTYGTLTDAGFSNGMHRIRYNLRVGYENHADYTDGGGSRVLNSRNKGYYFKGGAGFSTAKWKQYNFYNFSYNQFGFIIPELGSFFTPDDRQSRAMTGPHHNVTLHFLNSVNDFKLHSSNLQVIAGVQSNRRAEDEGGGQISLDVHLLSALESVIWTRRIAHSRLGLELRESGTYQTNKNYGPRILIPDARMMEGNASLKLSYDTGRHFLAALTIGVNDRSIQTFSTKYLNAPGKEAQPFAINRTAANVTLLTSVHSAKGSDVQWQVYNFISTGSRAANLAELSSDGLHEGSYQYEIGRADLATEQSLSESGGIEFVSRQTENVWLIINAAAYYNTFRNYIYLFPTNETRFGYPVFRYLQSDAHIAGGELSYMLYLKSNSLPEIRLQQALSLIEGVLGKNDPLPFIPPARLTSTLQCNMPWARWFPQTMRSLFVEPQFVYSFAQNKPAQNELSSPDYGLLNLNAGTSLDTKSGSYDFTLGIRNLLNKTYADYLSRIRYYGLNNQGLNVVLAVTVRR